LALWFFSPDLKDSRADGFEHETVAELIKQMPTTKVWHLALEPGMKQAGIFKKYKLRAEVQQTFLVDLNQTEETLLANIKEATRRNIRAAAKEITISDDKNCLKQLYDFQLSTMTGKGKLLPYDEATLKKILHTAIDHNSCAIWVARKGETIEAIVCQVWDDKQSYYLMGGQNPEANGYKAMSLLLWHCIRNQKNGAYHFRFRGQYG
jgi:lipid II:glycine glycyltransferase (peptidoglycan interpeptide bridge formation enzyme)